MMDTWLNPAPALRSAVDLRFNSSDQLSSTNFISNNISNNNNNKVDVSMNNTSMSAANSPASEQPQPPVASLDHAARFLPKPAASMHPSSPLGRCSGGLLAASLPAQASNSAFDSLRMLNEAFLLRDMVSTNLGFRNETALGFLQSDLLQEAPRVLIPKIDMLAAYSAQQKGTTRDKDYCEGPLKKRLKTGFPAHKQRLVLNIGSPSAAASNTAPVFVETTAEVKSTFPLPLTKVDTRNTNQHNNNHPSKHKKKRKLMLFEQMQTKWDRLECESDAMEHETDADQEAIVKECFLRSLHRYNADHLRQRLLRGSTANIINNNNDSHKNDKWVTNHHHGNASPI